MYVYIYTLYIYTYTIYETLTVQHSHESTCHRGQSAPGWTFGLGDLPPAVEVKALRWSLCHLLRKKKESAVYFMPEISWNLLKLTFILYIYAYLCIHTRQFKSRDDGDKGTMIGPDKEFKLWVVQNSWCWDSACRSGLQFVQMTWMCRASYAQWRLQLPPWHLCRQKEAALCWGNMFFWQCFLFLRNYVAFYICHMSWMRRRLWFDHKYPWILWCAMATCAWYIRGVK